MLRPVLLLVLLGAVEDLFASTAPTVPGDAAIGQGTARHAAFELIAFKLRPLLLPGS
jgi:hypothetical protein